MKGGRLTYKERQQARLADFTCCFALALGGTMAGGLYALGGVRMAVLGVASAAVAAGYHAWRIIRRWP